VNKYLITLCAIGALTLSPVCQAQFGGMLGGMLGGKKSEASADLGAQQDQLVRRYVAAGKDVLTANGHFADALGIKAQAVNASATSDSLSAKDIEDQDKVISADAAAVSEAIKSGAKLKDAEAKAKYAQGLVALASGVKKYVDMRNDAQGFASGLSSISPLQMGKLQAGAYILKNLPSSVTNLTSVLHSAVDFAKSNGVEVPKDATSLL
jgi:hypothetical protein